MFYEVVRKRTCTLALRLLGNPVTPQRYFSDVFRPDVMLIKTCKATQMDAEIGHISLYQCNVAKGEREGSSCLAPAWQVAPRELPHLLSLPPPLN